MDDTESTPDAERVLGEGELGQIRGILFGDQAAKTEQRITNLEADVRSMVADLDRRSSDSVSGLENTLKALIASETAARGEAMSEQRTALKDAHKELSKLLATETKDREKQAEKTLDTLTKTEARLLDAIQTARTEAITASTERSKADRKALASLLRDVASQLDADEASDSGTA